MDCLHTCSIRSPVPSFAAEVANSSNNALGSGSTKLKWKDSYRHCLRSSDIRLILIRVGETKYTAGTSVKGGRRECNCLRN